MGLTIMDSTTMDLAIMDSTMVSMEDFEVPKPRAEPLTMKVKIPSRTSPNLGFHCRGPEPMKMQTPIPEAYLAERKRSLSVPKHKIVFVLNPDPGLL